MNNNFRNSCNHSYMKRGKCDVMKIWNSFKLNKIIILIYISYKTIFNGYIHKHYLSL